MTVAEKKTKAYLDSIAPDEDRKMMLGYRFLTASTNKIKLSAKKKSGKTAPKKTVNCP